LHCLGRRRAPAAHLITSSAMASDGFPAPLDRAS
jgi:hypothetical protein